MESFHRKNAPAMDFIAPRLVLSAAGITGKQEYCLKLRTLMAFPGVKKFPKRFSSRATRRHRTSFFGTPSICFPSCTELQSSFFNFNDGEEPIKTSLVTEIPLSIVHKVREVMVWKHPLLHLLRTHQLSWHHREHKEKTLLMVLKYTPEDGISVTAITGLVGCVILYAGQERFHHSTTNTMEYVVNQADFTVDKLRNISDYLSAAKQLGVDQIFLPSNVQTDIDQIESKINSSASMVANKAADSSDDMHDFVDSVRLALIVITAIMLVLTFLGLLFSIFGMQTLVYILVITGWILVTGTFILCGTFLLLHNVAGDTCVAMNEWVQNPASHSALDEIMPCVDNATAQETLLRSKEVTSELVDLINQVITNVSNINFSPNFKPMYINQSGPLVPILCNPFRPDFTDRACSAGEVDLMSATEAWRNYVCQVSPAGICITTGRLTPAFYDQMTTGVSMGIALYGYAPFLVQLEDCTFVRETFSEIYVNHCPGLQRYSRWIYVGLVIVSTSVMLSLIFWVIYGRERRHRVFTKEVMARPTDEAPEGGKVSVREEALH